MLALGLVLKIRKPRPPKADWRYPRKPSTCRPTAGAVSGPLFPAPAAASFRWALLWLSEFRLAFFFGRYRQLPLHFPLRLQTYLAGPLGFEPRQSAPKALDLPLVDGPKTCRSSV